MTDIEGNKSVTPGNPSLLHTPSKAPGTEPGPILCPVCAEKGVTQPMKVSPFPTGYYFEASCPSCGNMALIERERVK